MVPTVVIDLVNQLKVKYSTKTRLLIPCKIQRINSLEHGVLLSSRFKGSVPYFKMVLLPQFIRILI